MEKEINLKTIEPRWSTKGYPPNYAEDASGVDRGYRQEYRLNYKSRESVESERLPHQRLGRDGKPRELVF